MQHDADSLAEGAPAAFGIEAEDRHLAPVAAAMPFEDLERRRLAGAVGAQEREHLALLDREAHPVHGAVRAIALLQAHDLYRRHGLGLSTMTPPAPT